MSAAAGSTPVVIAESSEELDRRIEESAVTIDFSSKAEEKAYEESDWRLHMKICDVCGVRASPTRDDGLVHLVEDWYPTRTKFVEADASVFGQAQVSALRSLLAGEHEEWRINVQIYRGLNAEKPEHLGGLNIYRNWTLVQRQVLRYVEKAA
jgi:hypothetical protein